MLQRLLSNQFPKIHTKRVVPILFVLLALRLLTKKRKQSDLPLAPFKYPFIGSTLDYYKNPYKLISHLTKKFGSTFRIHFHGDIATVVGAEDATEVFNHPNLSFLVSQSKFFNVKILHGSDVSKELAEIGVSSIAKYLMPNLDAITNRAYKEFLQDASLIKDDEFVVSNLDEFMRSFVSRASASLLTGDLCQNEEMFNTFKNSVGDIGKDFSPHPIRVLFPSLNKIYMNYIYKKSGTIEKYRSTIKRVLESTKEQMIQESRDNSPTSFINFIAITYCKDLDQAAMEMLTTILIVFIFVAAHTTSEAATYVTYCLAKYPEYMQELREEQDTVLQGDLIPTTALCKNMVKLDSFIHEALRIRKGGIGLAHTNITNHNVVLRSGVVVPPNTEALINLWDINFDKKRQPHSTDIKTFDGFRFVGYNTNATRVGRDNIIFGLGRHSCPGRYLAIYVLKSILSYFIRHYDISPVGDIIMPHSSNNGIRSPQGSVKFTKRKV